MMGAHSQYVRDTERYSGTPFKAHRSMGLTYAQQGLIFFTCLGYEDQSEQVRDKVDRLCRQVGGVYEKALHEKMTTGRPTVQVAQKHFISTSTLYALVRRFFQSWE